MIILCTWYACLLTSKLPGKCLGRPLNCQVFPMELIRFSSISSEGGDIHLVATVLGANQVEVAADCTTYYGNFYFIPIFNMVSFP